MVQGSMAKITRNQAEQIETTYNEISQISAQYPNVFVRKHSDDSYNPIATAEYNNGNIQMYVDLDGIRATMRNVTYCRINNDELMIGGTGGLITIDISDE